MRIQEDIRGEVAVLSVDGPLTTYPDVSTFKEYINQLVGNGTSKVVVDLSDVKWFGTPMLAELVSSVMSLRSAGGDLRLCGMTDRMASVLAATGLTSVVRILANADVAVDSFGQMHPGEMSVTTNPRSPGEVIRI